MKIHLSGAWVTSLRGVPWSWDPQIGWMCLFHRKSYLEMNENRGTPQFRTPSYLKHFTVHQWQPTSFRLWIFHTQSQFWRDFCHFPRALSIPTLINANNHPAFVTLMVWCVTWSNISGSEMAVSENWVYTSIWQRYFHAENMIFLEFGVSNFQTKPNYHVVDSVTHDYPRITGSRIGYPWFPIFQDYPILSMIPKYDYPRICKSNCWFSWSSTAAFSDEPT